MSTRTSASYNAGLLKPGRYYWKIVAKNNYGQKSGPLWHFDISYKNLSNGVAYGSFSGTTGHQRYFKIINVTAGSNLTVELYGGTGDADLYVKKNDWPSVNSYDWRSYHSGNTEKIELSNASGGTYYVMVNAYATYSGVNIKAQWSNNSVIIDEDFEGYALGNLTSIPWGSVFVSGSSYINIEQYGNPGKGATFYDPTEEGVAKLVKSWTSFKRGTLEFDFRIFGSDSKFGVRFYPVFEGPAIYIGDYGDGLAIYAQKANSERQKIMNISPSTYYSVKLYLYLDASSPYYRVYVNGTYKAQLSSVTDTTGIQFLCYSDRTCSMLDLDNINLVSTGTFISAPEQGPDSLGIDIDTTEQSEDM
ncbi:MAG: PPC domain-containing protein [Bacteroidales bacterium]|nr:PPC domain-containing protein [Bacteroidales bacterium]